jgi:5-methyltetrahydrofolate--homocysteine methyltransferase
MTLIGEKINTSRKNISDAVEKRDARFIIKVAKDQADAGADYIDVNAGTFLEKEVESLCWLVETVQSEIDIPLCLDSPDPVALREAIKVHKGEPLINSISLEKDRFESILPIISSQQCSVVALCMAQNAMPTTSEERVQAGSELIKRLSDNGIPIENIFVDPLVQPVSVDTNMAKATLEAIGRIMHDFPGVKTICGLSNISFGLPHRKLINRNFLTLCMAYGLSAAILDPTDKHLMATILSAEMLLGRDEYCENFINAHQAGIIGNI